MADAHEKSFLKTPHGTAKERGHPGPRVETSPADELSPPKHGKPIKRNPRGQVRDSEAARALAKMPRRSRFVPKNIATHPRFEAHNKARAEWMRKRVSEIQSAHGAVSTAVGAMLVAAGWANAAAECAAEMAAETLDFDLFKRSADLAAAARQNVLAAWELAAREASALAKTRRDNGVKPWEVSE